MESANRTAPHAPTAEAVRERLTGIFAEVLGLAEVGPDDDFFVLGGHSLTAGKIIGRVLRETGVRIGMAEFFDDPTVRGLADRIVTAG